MENGGLQGEQGERGLQGERGFNCKQGISGNISDICPTDTNLELQFVPEVINNGYIVTCSLNNLLIYVTWVDNTPGNGEIFFAAINDNGTTFDNPINISNNNGPSTRQQIAAVENYVYVTWEDSTVGNPNPEIYFAVSDDFGQTFSAPINLSNNTGFSEVPQIAAVGDHVYVTWEDNINRNTLDNFDIFLAVSSDNGKKFSPPKNISNNTGFSAFSKIAAVGDNVYVIWKEDTSANTNSEIFFAASNKNGQNFDAPLNISNIIGISELARIAAVGDNVYVTWHDNTFAITGK